MSADLCCVFIIYYTLYFLIHIKDILWKNSEIVWKHPSNKKLCKSPRRFLRRVCKQLPLCPLGPPLRCSPSLSMSMSSRHTTQVSGGVESTVCRVSVGVVSTPNQHPAHPAVKVQVTQHDRKLCRVIQWLSLLKLCWVTEPWDLSVTLAMLPLLLPLPPVFLVLRLSLYWLSCSSDSLNLG